MKTILLVDDDSRIHTIVAAYVNRFVLTSGKTVCLLSAYSTSEALELLSPAIDCVLQDGEVDAVRDSIAASVRFVREAREIIPAAVFVAISMSDENNDLLLEAGCQQSLVKHELVRGGPLLGILTKLFS